MKEQPVTPSKLDTLDEHEAENGMEVHPVIALLLARMESHPQEFYRYSVDPRTSARSTNPNTLPMAQATAQLLEHTKSLWNRREKRLYNMALRRVRLEEAYTRMARLILTADK